MTAYDDALAAEAKDVSIVWDFPDLDTRFITRDHSGLSHPSGWTVFEGAIPKKDGGSKVNIETTILTIGAATFEIPDVDGALTTWLRANDATIAQTEVQRKHGFVGVAESTYKTTYWVLEDFGVSGREGGGYLFELANSLRAAASPLFEEFEGQSYKLDDTAHPSGLLSTDTSITLDESPDGIWREPGVLILYDTDEDLVELVEYTAISAAGVVSGLTRRAWGVGVSGKTFPTGNTSVYQVWARRGSPIDIALELLTTTEAGASATENVTNGDLEAWTASVLDSWTTTVTGGSTVTEETTIVRGGASSAEILAAGGGTCQLSQVAGAFDKDDYLVLSIYARAEAVANPSAIKVYLQNTTASKYWNRITGWGSSPVQAFTVALTEEPGTEPDWASAASSVYLAPYGSWVRVIVVVPLDDASFGTADSYTLTVDCDQALVEPVDIDDVSLRGPYDEEPNGAYDRGDGDGLGIPVEWINVTNWELLRDTYWPSPGFDGSDALTAGTAILLCERKPIKDVKKFIEKHLLRPFAFFLRLDDEEKLDIEIYYRVPPATTIVDDEWRKGDFKASTWRRNLPDTVNQLKLATDWNPGEENFGVEKLETQDASISRYGASKPGDVEGRGHRTGLWGFPDYSAVSVSNIATAGRRILLELANPASPLRIRPFYAHKDVALGSLVRLNVPGIPNLSAGVMGVTGGLFQVTRRRLDDQKGFLELEVRARRPVFRPAVVAPNTVASTYTAASDADREYCYLCSNDGSFSASGDEGYTVP